MAALEVKFDFLPISLQPCGHRESEEFPEPSSFTKGFYFVGETIEKYLNRFNDVQKIPTLILAAISMAPPSRSLSHRRQCRRYHKP